MVFHDANVRKKRQTALFVERKIVYLHKNVEMRRICFVVDSIFSVGGVQRVTSVIARELAKDYDVTIATFDRPDAKNSSLYGLQEPNISYRFLSYPKVNRWEIIINKIYSGLYLKFQPKTKWFSDLYARSSFPAKLRNALTRELIRGNYQVIIGVHAPLAARLSTIKDNFPHTKLIGWVHNSFEALFCDTSLYIGAKRKRHYVYQFTKLDKVILLCQHDVNSYLEYDSKFNPIAIYNPLTLQPSLPSQGNSKRFLAVGRFSHLHKGFDLLIEAFHLFAQNNKEWILDIVGEGVEEELYRSLIEQYQLEDRISIHPFTSNIQEYYSQAQVYVLSSRWEGFGLVLVEAMAHGLPVVSSDLPTSQEIMGDFGIYFKNGDIKDLAQKLHDATHIDWQAKTKQAVAIAQKFNISQIIAQWKQVIDE